MRIGVLMIVSLLSVACSRVYAETDAEWQAYRAIKYNDVFEGGEPEGSRCNLHDTPLVVAVVAREAGMCVQPPRRYVRALVHEFPHSQWSVHTCFCEPDGLSFAVRSVCPVCREAERRWRKRHGWSVEDEMPLPDDAP